MSGAVADAQRLWHTVRHLKPVQVWGRAWRMVPGLPPDLGPAPERRPPVGAWVHPPRHPSSLVGPARMRHLNVEHDLSAIGWDGGSVDRLWRYHQHYFDDVVAKGAPERAEWHRALIARWIAENPPGRGVGWEPYPTSRRIVNWITMELEGHQLSADATHSLAAQARWLARHVEWHLLGNHLVANAKGLLFAGLFFMGSEADAWRQTAVNILSRQVPEQVLSDGGHFERSPMYHAIVLEDFLDIVNLTAAYGATAGDDVQGVAATLRSTASLMLRWLSAMVHPDGEISFFNDAAFGVAAPYRELQAYAAALGVAESSYESRDLITLEPSGSIRIEQGPVVAILDVGPVGPDYLPGHAHADTLSWELSFEGCRVLCNSGTSVYGTGPERQRQRGTAAHNTVTIDGLDSSEVWAGFRVARRARPFGLNVVRTADGMTVSCAHDGYTRLPGRPLHVRHWSFSDHSIEVRDEVRGPGEALSHWHWHPDVIIESDEHGGGLTARLPNGRCLRVDAEGMSLRSEPTTWHPEFSASRPTTKTVGMLRGKEAVMRLWWD